MPKMKTHSGAKKRFRKTATGKLRGRRAYSSHILEKKSPKRKRQMARRSRSRPPTRKQVRKLLGRQEVSRANERRRPPQAAQEDPHAGEGLLRPQALLLPLRQRAGAAVGPCTPTATGATASATFRRLWITRINAAARREGMSYSELMHGLKQPESRSTARCSPTSPSATARLSADLSS